MLFFKSPNEYLWYSNPSSDCKLFRPENDLNRLSPPLSNIEFFDSGPRFAISQVKQKTETPVTGKNRDRLGDL
jgi:hypothetical protein